MIKNTNDDEIQMPDTRREVPCPSDRSGLPRQAASPSERLPRVQIVNRKHPHFEEYGRFTGKVITMVFDDKTMAEVKLEHCRHGTDGCYVSKGDVKQVAER